MVFSKRAHTCRKRIVCVAFFAFGHCCRHCYWFNRVSIYQRLFFICFWTHVNETSAILQFDLNRNSNLIKTRNKLLSGWEKFELWHSLLLSIGRYEFCVFFLSKYCFCILGTCSRQRKHLYFALKTHFPIDSNWLIIFLHFCIVCSPFAVMYFAINTNLCTFYNGKSVCAAHALLNHLRMLSISMKIISKLLTFQKWHYKHNRNQFNTILTMANYSKWVSITDLIRQTIPLSKSNCLKLNVSLSLCKHFVRHPIYMFDLQHHINYSQNQTLMYSHLENSSPITCWRYSGIKVLADGKSQKLLQWKILCFIQLQKCCTMLLR